MSISFVIPRPQPEPFTRWTGDNLTELEMHYSTLFNTTVTFSVNNEGALVIEGYSFNDPSPVPVGRWFTPGRMGTTSNEDFLAFYQEITGDAPYIYTTESTP
jgi:hypothetical protein